MKTSYQQYNSSIMPAIRVFARKGVEFEAAFRLIMEDVIAARSGVGKCGHYGSAGLR